MVTGKHFPYAKEYFEFLEREGIDNAGFCYCYNPLDDYAIDPGKLGKFLCECFDIYYHSKRRVHIREFENLLRKMYGAHRISCVNKERCECGNFMAFTPDGTVCFCDAYEKDSKIVGNLKEDGIGEIIRMEAYQRTREEYAGTAKDACGDCRWKCVCGCGCARNDCVTDAGVRSNYFCRTHKMLCEHIFDTIAKDGRLSDRRDQLLDGLKEMLPGQVTDRQGGKKETDKYRK